jgi:hypothetical protein
MTWFLYSKKSRINDTHSQGYYCQTKSSVTNISTAATSSVRNISAARTTSVVNIRTNYLVGKDILVPNNYLGRMLQYKICSK